VNDAIERLGLVDAIERTGYLRPESLARALDDAQLHVSVSSCETFGRAIIETLALGLPGLAMRSNNAAYAFLHGAPYVRFVDSFEEAHAAVDDLLANPDVVSSAAAEVGDLFDDEVLRRVLAAEVREDPAMAVCDYDGTLYHKDDPKRTARCLEAFASYPSRVVCSARPVEYLVEALQRHGLHADFLVGWSGAVLADGHGRAIHRWPLDVAAVPNAAWTSGTPVESDGEVLQLALGPHRLAEIPPGLRLESYQGEGFLGSRSASKLHAVLYLLRHTGWSGRVRAFGDGPHDDELLTWFDGTCVHPIRQDASWLRRATEVTPAPQ
jgi:hypothetical protein